MVVRERERDVHMVCMVVRSVAVAGYTSKNEVMKSNDYLLLATLPWYYSTDYSCTNPPSDLRPLHKGLTTLP